VRKEGLVDGSQRKEAAYARTVRRKNESVLLDGDKGLITTRSNITRRRGRDQLQISTNKKTATRRLLTTS